MLPKDKIVGIADQVNKKNEQISNEPMKFVLLPGNNTNDG